MRWQIAQAVEVKWWNNYLRNKDKEEYYTWKKAYWVDFLNDISCQLPDADSHILDAGCGPAGIFTILDKYHVTAVDPLLDKYRQNLDQFDVSDYPYTHFLTSSLEQIPLSHSYDMVFCLNVINHVKSIQSSLRKLYDALKPGGKLVISTDAHNSNFLKHIFQLIPGDILHPHQFNIEEYESFINNAGFQISSSKKVKSETIFSYWVIQAYRPH